MSFQRSMILHMSRIEIDTDGKQYKSISDSIHMSVDDKLIDVAKEATKVVAKDVYTDFVKPILKPTGEVIGLVPRTIRAVLSPLERLVLQSEYNVEKTRKLLEEKLKDVPPERIEPPEPYIAVPALQYLSYCMDNHELRDL